jgi:hypothetical protein
MNGFPQSRGKNLWLAGLAATLVVAALPAGAQTAQQFYALTPCRVVDTRVPIDPAVTKRGAFADDEARAYTLSTSTDCPGLPGTATAWSVNIQYRPSSQAGFLTAYPDGVTRPVVSTLVGYPDTWIVNNAIVPAGSGGTFDIYCQYAGNVVIDVNGYFAP